jgi:hypothetical protein
VRQFTSQLVAVELVLVFPGGYRVCVTTPA